MEKKMIRVVDVPAAATAEEAEALLNAPYADGYYLERLQPKNDELAARAFFKLRTRNVSGKGA